MNVVIYSGFHFLLLMCVCAETQKTSSALTQHINSTLVIHKIRENQEKSSTLRAQNMRPTFQTRKMSSILETFGVLNQSIHVILGWMVLDGKFS